MIKGIGIDIVNIDRLRKNILRWGEKFENRIFTPQEINCQRKNEKMKSIHLGGRFAAKEAVFKSLGIRTSWQNIQILSTKEGKPYVSLGGKIKEIAKKKGIKLVLVTISHDTGYAIAEAVAIGEGNEISNR